MRVPIGTLGTHPIGVFNVQSLHMSRTAKKYIFICLRWLISWISSILTRFFTSPQRKQSKGIRFFGLRSLVFGKHLIQSQEDRKDRSFLDFKKPQTWLKYIFPFGKMWRTAFFQNEIDDMSHIRWSITACVETMRPTPAMLARTWKELHYRLDVVRGTDGTRTAIYSTAK